MRHIHRRNRRDVPASIVYSIEKVRYLGIRSHLKARHSDYFCEAEILGSTGPKGDKCDIAPAESVHGLNRFELIFVRGPDAPSSTSNGRSAATLRGGDVVRRLLP